MRPYELLIFDWEGTLVDPNSVFSAHLFPKTGEVLQTLHNQGYLLAIATAKSKLGLNADLEKTQLKSLISATCTAEESAPKPDPLMLLMLLEQLAIKPQAALMIGDTVYDLTMAKRANIAAVGVGYGLQTCEALQVCQPLTCLQAITELPTWLAKCQQPLNK